MTGKPLDGRISADAADTMALRAVAFLAADDARLGGFLAATGILPSDLARLVRDRAFLASVMDFLLADEALAAAFSAGEGLAPGAMSGVRAALPGGDVPNWT